MPHLELKVREMLVCVRDKILVKPPGLLQLVTVRVSVRVRVSRADGKIETTATRTVGGELQLNWCQAAASEASSLQDRGKRVDCRAM